MIAIGFYFYSSLFIVIVRVFSTLAFVFRRTNLIILIAYYHSYVFLAISLDVDAMVRYSYVLGYLLCWN